VVEVFRTLPTEELKELDWRAPGIFFNLREVLSFLGRRETLHDLVRGHAQVCEISVDRLPANVAEDSFQGDC
jgi:hypothetical protein